MTRLLDARSGNPYVANAMNLLLLLTALLSALTGVSGAISAPAAASAITASEPAAGRATIAPRAPARRPVLTLPKNGSRERYPVVTAFALPAIEPLFAARRRE